MAKTTMKELHLRTNWNDMSTADDYLENPELMIRECFLQATDSILNMGGVEKYAIEQIEGATQMLKEFVSLNDSLHDVKNSK